VRQTSVQALRRLGFDVLTTLEARRESESDESQLEFATREARVVLTGNDGDFSRLQAEWGIQGREHPGIVVVRQQVQSKESTAEAVFGFASSLAGNSLANAIYHL
jgi:hypothetical protein